MVLEVPVRCGRVLPRGAACKSCKLLSRGRWTFEDKFWCPAARSRSDMWFVNVLLFALLLMEQRTEIHSRQRILVRFQAFNLNLPQFPQ